MADLTSAQSSTPVELINETSGNTVAVNSDGSLNDNLAKVGGTAVALGQTTMSASIPTVLASDQSSVKVTQEATKATYSAGFTGLVPVASATDVFTITGSATKTIRIVHMSFNISTTAGSGTSFNATLLKRSTADSGGTSTTASIVPHDSNDAAGTAVIRGYTANPTTGTLVGIVHSERTEAATAGATRNSVDWSFAVTPAKGIVLRGTGEVLAINFNGITITSPVMGCDVQWTEE